MAKQIHIWIDESDIKKESWAGYTDLGFISIYTMKVNESDVIM